jgi:CBS domain-containing protein
MTRDVTCCRPADLLTDVWSIMKERGLKHVPIVDESTRPLGVLYARDALQVLLREVEYEELLLRDYVWASATVDVQQAMDEAAGTRG